MINYLKSIAATLALSSLTLLPNLASAQGYYGNGGYRGGYPMMMSGLGFGGFGFIALLCLAGMIFWIMMLIHVATHKSDSQLIWALIVVFTGLVGAIIYYFLVVRQMSSLPPTPPAPPTSSNSSSNPL